MKEVYFFDGMFIFGDEDVMIFKVGNFKGEEVEERFILVRYIIKYKFINVRFYFLIRLLMIMIVNY